MNYLQIAQRLQQEAAMTGTAISTCVGQSGDLKRIADWASMAWTDIQTDNPDWSWMRKTVTFNTVANQGTYVPTTDMSLTDFASWRNHSFRLYLTSAGVNNEFLLTQWDYDSFRDYYLLGSRRVTYARPVNYAVTPEKNIVLGLPPEGIYTVTGEYFKTPVTLAADADTPDMPSRWHMAIVYRAMMYYASYESAGEVYAVAEKEYRRIMDKVRIDQGPRITFAGSLM